MVGHGQRVAVPAVAELELALEVGTPEVVRRDPCGERRARRAMARPTDQLDQAVPVQHGVDGALGRDADVAIQTPNEQLADLAGSPMGLVALEADDQALDLLRQLVGVSHRPPRAVAQGLEPVLLVAVEDLVPGLPRDPELAADLRHRLAVQQPRDEPQTLVHHRTLLPGHRHLPPGMPGGRCHPCVRYDLSPMSRAAHALHGAVSRIARIRRICATSYLGSGLREPIRAACGEAELRSFSVLEFPSPVLSWA